MTQDLDSFRAETRAWLEANCPPSMRTPMAGEEDAVWGGRNYKFAHPDQKLWLDRMGERGWTAPTWPKQYGGGGLSAEANRVLQSELKRIGARPPIFSFGIWMLGPVLLEYASEEQKRERILVPRRLVEGEGESRSVWVAEADGTARKRTVTLGEAGTEDLVEVAEGLRPTDRLIAGGRESLEDGDRIAIAGEDAA